jgi:hypothetical protein
MQQYWRYDRKIVKENLDERGFVMGLLAKM